MDETTPGLRPHNWWKLFEEESTLWDAELYQEIRLQSWPKVQDIQEKGTSSGQIGPLRPLYYLDVILRTQKAPGVGSWTFSFVFCFFETGLTM
jgi:hypothetical protein